MVDYFNIHIPYSDKIFSLDNEVNLNKEVVDNKESWLFSYLGLFLIGFVSILGIIVFVDQTVPNFEVEFCAVFTNAHILNILP